MAGKKTSIKLPELHPAAWRPIERLLAHRRSVRDFAAGAFDDQGVKRAVPLEGSEVPLALMPLGRPL
ncbi:MAG: hypothetical protein M1392_05110 [Gammaproteobacteria bacterium]|nr:hypothetical protein [Gammaproteobacteria bacterium]